MTFIDRWNPVRVSAYWAVFSIIGIFMNWTWVFVDSTGQGIFLALPWNRSDQCAAD